MIPLYSTEQVRAADNYAISKLQIPSNILMENAAISIADVILQQYPYIDLSYKIGIVCGKGNNGGDGFALARHLLIKGFDVCVISLAKEKDLKGDSLKNYNIFSNLIIDYDKSKLIDFESIRDLQYVSKCDIVVDAILGTGSSGELKEPYVQIVKKLNDISSLKIAIDAPTGLNLNNASGSVIFNANLTVTLAELKSGLFYEKGKQNSGKVIKGSIGIGDSYFNSLTVNEYLIEPEDVLGFLPNKKSDINKYSAGKVLTIAGSGKLPGAAFFSMNASMISGAGAGILAFPKSIKSLAQSQMNSAIVYSFEDNGNEYLQNENVNEINENIKWADVIAIGPGLGRDIETQKAVLQIIEKHSNKMFVIDADAIYALRRKKYQNINLEGNVLTPHHKEFADLLGIDTDYLKLSLVSLGRKFVKETKTFLVLKGAPTIIFKPDGEIFVNSVGNSGMAKFGSGDVLTGIIASFISQQSDVENAVISSVYLHSLTADLILKKESEFGITPQKLIEQFPATIKFLRKSIV